MIIVLSLLKQYFNIAFLMGKPQDLPAGQAQLLIGVALNLVTYIIAMLVIYGGNNAFLHALLDIGLTGIVLYIALSLTSKLPRFEQSFGALCGASAVLNLCTIFMIYPIVSAGDAGMFGELAYYLILVWSLSLGGHIVRHTFDINMVSSICVAVVYYIFMMNVLMAVLPRPADEIEGVQAPSINMELQASLV